MRISEATRQPIRPSAKLKHPIWLPHALFTFCTLFGQAHARAPEPPHNLPILQIGTSSRATPFKCFPFKSCLPICHLSDICPKPNGSIPQGKPSLPTQTTYNAQASDKADQPCFAESIWQISEELRHSFPTSPLRSKREQSLTTNQ